jgi:glycosyltransferase involved in cell wall biosynthesis
MSKQNRSIPFIKPLAVALVTETWPPEVNGVALSTWQLARRLNEQAVALRLVRPWQEADHPAAPEAPPEVGDSPSLKVPGLGIPFYPGLKLGLPLTGRLQNAWQQQRPDLVHITTEGPLGAAALWVARRLGLPVLSDYHTHFDLYGSAFRIPLGATVARQWLGWFHRRCDSTVVPTRALQRELAERGWPAVEVVGRGLKDGLFSPARRKHYLREIWGVGPDDPVVLLVSRLSPEKNLDLALEAFREMQAVDPRCRLVVVGDGPSRADLQRQVPEARFCGMRHGTELASHYASADIFLFPSLSETYGNVVPEAMASGLAVVAFGRAAASEHIRNGLNGLLAAPDQPRAFVEAALSLVKHPRLAASLGARAPEAVAGMGWSDIASRQRELYERILSRRTQHVATAPEPRDAGNRDPRAALVCTHAPLGQSHPGPDPA